MLRWYEHVARVKSQTGWEKLFQYGNLYNRRVWLFDGSRSSPSWEGKVEHITGSWRELYKSSITQEKEIETTKGYKKNIEVPDIMTAWYSITAYNILQQKAKH